MARIKRIGSLSYQFLSIPSIITRRNITWLCHFTPRQNLESIKQNGLLPRNLLPQGALTTDQYRADRSNAICLSISKPNKWMFEMKQNQGMDLCLILINPAVLYEKNCFFYPHNAATKSFRDVPSVMLQGNNALEALFAPEVTYQKAQKEQQSIYRHSFLSDCETTSDQAEVQCLEKIEPHYILHIFDENIPLDFATIKAYMASKEINENKAQGGRLNKSQNQSSAWRLNATQNETESENIVMIQKIACVLWR